ncbi:hypothetical protein [Natronolimnobius baerhuensis]|uniref:Uncharacterized protein n=1 Tax=Natronolimnobius baerhuensis TaxID=253108 RepID=A0A202E4K6_9EURY|nr:hypothetical protein [Natronolimnobius baerhuensis]OVE83226.1 hypothetical protein B2G88_17640 [Natronolimnobius baerhuensis]
MEFPRPDGLEYLNTTVTVVVLLAVFHYTGIFVGTPGNVDWWSLATVAVLLPVCIYCWSLVVANVDWLPSWDEKTRSKRH